MVLKDADMFYQRLSNRMEWLYMADFSEMQREPTESKESRDRQHVYESLYS